ncbi:MAG TPA: ATP-binding protein, partial [Clostridiales bacterium]|nr:ATP-binding protein [Clostridiales bacterium]
MIFNNAGILFFAKDLSKFYRHAKITCALYKGIEKNRVLDRKDFNEDVVSNIDKAMLFLGQHIPVRYEFDGSPQRKEFYQVPLEALREAIINAVCHRNYFEYGANIMVEIFDDRIDITSPGGLVPGLTEKEFGTKSVLRNPNIAALFHRIEYIEQMGTGINRMQGQVKEYGLNPISFSFTGFVTANFWRGVES